MKKGLRSRGSVSFTVFQVFEPIWDLLFPIIGLSGFLAVVWTYVACEQRDFIWERTVEMVGSAGCNRTQTFLKDFTFSPFSDSVSFLSLHHLLLLGDFFFRLNSPVFSLHLSSSPCITLSSFFLFHLFFYLHLSLSLSLSLCVSLTTQYLILCDRSHFKDFCHSRFM